MPDPPPGAGPGSSASPVSIGKLKASFPPPKIILNAVEGWGKTTTGAYAPNPLILMAAGESGAETLRGAGLIPEVPAGMAETWPSVLATIDAMIDGTQTYDTLVLDAMSGFEKLCHQHVCDKEFGGDWGEKGFFSYHKGYDVSVPEWKKLLARLDRLRVVKDTTILLLSHTQIRTHKDPVTEDYDRYVANCHPKTWAETSQWADAVLCGLFQTAISKGPSGKGRAKGVGGTMRVLHTEWRATWNAKNRYNMPPMLTLTDKPEHNWPIIWNAIQGEKHA